MHDHYARIHRTSQPGPTSFPTKSIDVGPHLHLGSGTSTIYLKSTDFAATSLAELLLEPDNDNAMMIFTLSVAIGIGTFVIVISPLIASYVLHLGDRSKGWVLRKGEWQREPKLPLKPQTLVPSSTIYAYLRYWYNITLLRPFPIGELTVGQVCVCTLYELIALWFLFSTADDLVANFQRPGYIVIAQLPIVFSLGTKNSLIWAICSRGFVGRTIIAFSIYHTILLLKHGPLDWHDPINITGTTALLAMLLMFFTSLPWVRRWSYEFFIYCHILGYVIMVIAMNVHLAPACRPYSYVAISVFLFDLIIRATKTRSKVANLIPLPGEMTQVSVQGLSDGWTIGDHARIRVAGRLLEIHPFSIANASAHNAPASTQRDLTMMIHSAGNFTKWLHQKAKTLSFETIGYANEKEIPGVNVNVWIDGPYSGTGFLEFTEFQSVLLFCGGSGITFGASTVESLIGLTTKSRNMNKHIILVWSARNAAVYTWYKETFEQLLRIADDLDVNLEIRLYCTKDAPDKSPIYGASMNNKRPDMDGILGEVVDETIEASSFRTGGGVLVGVCGPSALVKSGREALGKIDRKKQILAGGLSLHSECFGW